MKRTLFTLICLLFVLTACEDVIDIKLDKGTVQLTVDAWLTNKPGAQTIRLTQTAPYFSNKFNPPATGAEVVVSTDNGNTLFRFTDENNDGNYRWTPTKDEAHFGEIGKTYLLSVRYRDETFVSAAQMKRTAKIDSLRFIDKDKSDGIEIEGELFAKDPKGEGDCYWIKTHKNGHFLDKPAEINLAYDAGTTPGENIDGMLFIPPVRTGINPVPDDVDEEFISNELFWEFDDSVVVEVHSIGLEAFYFLQQAQRQMTNGGMFAEPSANVSTNIKNANSKSKVKAVGFFSVSAVSSVGKKLIKSEIVK